MWLVKFSAFPRDFYLIEKIFLVKPSMPRRDLRPSNFVRFVALPFPPPLSLVLHHGTGRPRISRSGRNGLFFFGPAFVPPATAVVSMHTT